MKRTILIYTILGIFCCAAKAQISTEELPYSWGKGVERTTIQSIPVITLPFLDMETLRKEDRNNENRFTATPFRFGFPHEVKLSLSNSGIWSTTSNGGRLWTLRLYSPDAISLNLLYDKFWLPYGAKFWIYSEDMTEHIGAFTSQNNKGCRENNLGFATGFLFTNSIVLEYYEPKGVESSGIISISQVVSGYRHANEITGGNNQPRNNHPDLLYCQIDVNCPEGNDWQQEKNAVALVIMGNMACTGALLNTTANDNRPLFLMADHCAPPALTYSTQWIFYWNYEAAICGGNVSRPSNRSTGGATMLARWRDTDFMLMNLAGNGNPARNPNVTPYYLGWDRTSAIATSGAGIHHPRTSPKKISITDSLVVSNPYPLVVDYGDHGLFIFPPYSHWRVVFTYGTAEPGSSGSPFLNQDKRVIGQLNAGHVRCDPPAIMYYGRFDVSWAGGGTAITRLSDWLDPIGTNQLVLDGMGREIPASCVDTFIDQPPITSNRTIIACGNDLEVKNIIITNGATLTITAMGVVSISGLVVHSGSRLVINVADVIIEPGGLNIELGAQLDIR